MVCFAPRAREDSVRPRRLSGASGRPLNFTVRAHAQRFHASGGDVNAESRGPTLEYERLVIHRRLLAWVHAALGSITAVVYLSQIDFRRLAYWRIGAGFGTLFIIALPVFPYILSAVHSRRVVTPNRIRLAIFIMAVATGCALMALLLVGVFGPVSRLALLLLFFVQAFAYIWAAEGILHNE